MTLETNVRVRENKEALGMSGGTHSCIRLNPIDLTRAAVDFAPTKALVARIATCPSGHIVRG
jgi:hypothetical protein